MVMGMTTTDADAAAATKLRSEVESFRGGMLGYTVFKRTYAAELNNCSKEDDSTESFQQCIIGRLMNSDLIATYCQFSEQDKDHFSNFLLKQKCSLSGRYLQSLGLQKIMNGRSFFYPLTSCAFTTISDPIRPFVYAAQLSIHGAGVGYSIQREYVNQLPRVQVDVQPIRQDSNEADFVVPNDKNRQGWIRLFELLLTAYFFGGGDDGNNNNTNTIVENVTTPTLPFTYSLHLLKESCISDTILSGLEDAIKNLSSVVLRPRVGKKVRPIDCMDIMNIMVPAVVLGRKRRAALLAMGDADDMEFLQAKRWDLIPNLPLWRSASNNSIVCNDITSNLPKEFWEGYEGKGEAMGLVNLDLFRSCGRVGETMYADPNVRGVSACAEQGLDHEEVSCLAELMLPTFTSSEELWEATRLVYTVCKCTYLLDGDVDDGQQLLESTTNMARSNYRMGIGITGYMEATEEQKSWLSCNYERLRAYDVKYSTSRGLAPSIKLTTVKPSGTISILSGNTPGCHPGYSQYYIRRVRFNADCPVLKKCRAMKLKIEPERGFDGKTSTTGRYVVEFPMNAPKHTQLAENTSAIDQLEVVRRLQTEWSDSAVSVTVYYKREELADIREWLSKHYNSNIKACSFLLHSDHGFDQAPYEKISESQYLDLISCHHEE